MLAFMVVFVVVSVVVCASDVVDVDFNLVVLPVVIDSGLISLGGIVA